MRRSAVNVNFHARDKNRITEHFLSFVHLGVLTISRYNDYRSNMSKAAKTKPSREEAVFLELVRTADILSRRPAEVIKAAELSPTQYNVLRILRGAAELLTCGEISKRMITRDPDITRLVDRLENRGLISRSRESRDRRTVLVQITKAGLALLASLDEPIQDAHRSQLAHLGEKRLKQLSELLSTCRNC